MDKNWRRLGRLPPEEKVAICMDMSDGCVLVCAEGIRAQNPGLTDDEVVEKLRERLEWSKRHRRK